MSGFCSRHQYYNKECSTCNALKPIPKVLFQTSEEPEESECFISIEVDSGNCCFYVPKGYASISKEEARTLLAGLIHFVFCGEDEDGHHKI